MPTPTGADNRIIYKWEDQGSFNQGTGSVSDSTWKTFGANVNVDTWRGSHQAVRVFGNPNSREATNIIEQAFDGAISVSFDLTNFWWIQAILGTLSTSDASAPYSYTPDDKVPRSMHVLNVAELDTDNEDTATGAYYTSADVSVNVGGNVRITLDGAYADADHQTDVSSLTAQKVTEDRPFTFARASLSIGGTTKNLVQDVGMTIENNTDGIGEIGSRFLVDYSPKVRATSVSYGDIVDDDTEKDRFYDGSTSPPTEVTNTDALTFLMDNGGSTGNKHSLSLDASISFPEQYGRSGIGDPESDLEGNINEMVGQVTCTGQTDESTAL